MGGYVENILDSTMENDTIFAVQVLPGRALTPEQRLLWELLVSAWHDVWSRTAAIVDRERARVWVSSDADRDLCSFRRVVDELGLDHHAIRRAIAARPLPARLSPNVLARAISSPGVRRRHERNHAA